ncbi:diaminopimelate dehydrogenase [Paenibacillus sp. ACRRX]|uniref:diaminopimelate dehydrogenase n=1 Tax=Paenibacillus sp. ACRRX TaxID=2918206 RepID=UPI001EF5B2AF|nr:diaminopimelate dehydrogenase [Paenibacillus sp. ACRRX]MCG7408665.1 diaminopimelate dehydrogenase [Paenibacillus sp. ACRRX]
MQAPIRIGIVGYGNLGRGVEQSIRQNPDMELVAVFTRRQPEMVQASVPVVALSEAHSYKDRIDVMILCGGSATDLPEQGPQLAELFHTVDSFDTHARIPEYFDSVNHVAVASGHVSVISTGWDPGLFSLNRLLFEAVLPEGNEYTFWGRGVSQGHSDAIRRIAGVQAGVQYTIPSDEAVAQVRRGDNPTLSTRDKHLRECFVVAEAGADQAHIEQEIKTMPNYFVDYDTIVHFITEEELRANHSDIPHGGLVFRSGITGEGTKQIMEFGLNLGSNPEFTSSVLVAYARAAYRLAQRGENGARTVFDIPFGLLSPKSAAELRQGLL